MHAPPIRVPPSTEREAAEREAGESDLGPPPGGLFGPILRVRTFQALRYPGFRLLWFGQMGVAMGMWMDQVARGWLMYELTGSALELGLVRAVQAIPFLVLSPIAGIMADRYGRKGQLVAAQGIDTTLYALVAILVFSGHIQPWHLYGTALGTAIVQVFQQPARQALVFEAVPVRHLTNAIGLDSLVFNGSRSTGPALSGAIIATVGTGGSYAVQAFFYALSTIWTMQINLKDRPTDLGHSEHSRSKSVVGGTQEAWRFIVRNEAVRTAILVAMLVSFLGQPFSTLLPIFAKDILQIGPTGQGLLLTAMGIGAVSAAVLIASLSNTLPKGLLMVCGATLFGLSLIAFAYSPWFALSAALMVLLGLCNVSCHALVRTVVQTHSPQELQGRMMGFFQQTQVVYTLGSLMAGALASALGASTAVAIIGAACALSGATIFIAFPRARLIR